MSCACERFVHRLSFVTVGDQSEGLPEDVCDVSLIQGDDGLHDLELGLFHSDGVGLERQVTEILKLADDTAVPANTSDATLRSVFLSLLLYFSPL